MKLYRFEHVAGFLIGYDESWHLKVTASNAYSAPKWPDVWAGKFECHGGVAKMTIENEEVIMCRARCSSRMKERKISRNSLGGYNLGCIWGACHTMFLAHGAL